PERWDSTIHLSCWNVQERQRGYMFLFDYQHRYGHTFRRFVTDTSKHHFLEVVQASCTEDKCIESTVVCHAHDSISGRAVFEDNFMDYSFSIIKVEDLRKLFLAPCCDVSRLGTMQHLIFYIISSYDIEYGHTCIFINEIYTFLSGPEAVLRAISGQQKCFVHKLTLQLVIA